MRSIRPTLLIPVLATALSCLPPLPEMGDSASGNLPPTVHTVQIQAHSASDEAEPLLYTDDVALAIVDASDPDGDDVTLSFVWSVDGTEVPGTGDTEIPGTSETLASENYARGQTVAVTVIPHDGRQEGEPLSDEIVVSNTPPPAPSVALSQLNRCGALAYLATGADMDVSAIDSDALVFDEEFTVELWLAPAASEETTPRFLFGQSRESSEGEIFEAYQLEERAGQLLLLLPDLEQPIEHLEIRNTSEYNLDEGSWNHVLLSYNNGTWLGFINGDKVLEYEDSARWSGTNRLPFWLGTNPAHVNETANFVGYIHSVRMSKTALYTEDFNNSQMSSLYGRPLRSNPESTVALWTFGPPADTAGQYEDLSGNGNILSVNGTGYVDSETGNSCPWDDYVDLRCAVAEEHMDPDGDGLNYEFHWYANGSKEDFAGPFHDGADHLYQDLYQEDRDDYTLWSCQVSASDGKTSGLPGLAETIIED